MTEIDLTPPALNLHLAERALAKGHRARAEAICTQLCKSEPCNPDVLAFLGRCWISTFAGAVGTPGHVASRLLNPYVFGLDYDPWTPTTTFHYARHDEDWSGTVHHIVKALEKQFSLE